MDYNGKNVSTVLAMASDYPYALTQSLSKLFWTDWKTVYVILFFFIPLFLIIVKGFFPVVYIATFLCVKQ